MNYSKLLILLLLLSACNSFDDKEFYKKCSKVVEHSIQGETRDITKNYIRTGLYVRDAGNKEFDVKVYKTAQGFYKRFSVLQNEIRLSENNKEQEIFITAFLDSVYSLKEFSPESIKDRRAQIKAIYASTMATNLKKILLQDQMTFLEKEIIKLHLDQVSYCDLIFDSIYPVIVWDKDTVTEGDSLRGKIFIYENHINIINKLINKVEINQSSIQSDQYNNYTFTIAPPASVVFDSKGESLQHWEGKVWYTNVQTLKDSIIIVKGNYIIERKN